MLPLLLAPLSLAVGVVLMFIPGPAVLFFALAGALLASHSMPVARALDWLELKLRAALAKGRAWWSRASPAKKSAVVLALLLVVAGIGAAALELLIWS